MFVEHIQAPGRRSTELHVYLGSVLLDFALLIDLRGRPRLVAEVPREHEVEIRQRVAAHPDYKIRPASLFDRKPLAADAPVSRSPERPVIASTPVDLALANLWLAEDLTGTGAGGDPGPAGGFSAVTGLNLGQMVMSVAPTGWGGLRDTHWPWDVADWIAPPNFKQPAVAPKVQPVEQPRTTAEVVNEVSAIINAPVPVVAPKRNTLTLPDDLRYGAPDADAAAEAAANELKTLWGGRGARPSLAKVRAALQRNDLPPLAEDDETAKLQLKSLFDNLYP
jgi:hypothetical protein